MKKNILIKSTIILTIGGFITKILGMLIKIVITRMIGTEGIGLYNLIMPTFMLLITISQLGFPTAISKIVSAGNMNNKSIIFKTTLISIIINIFLIIFMLISSNYIATNLLHDNRCKYALICTSLVLPFISISSILRGYFFGKQRMIPHVITNIAEDIIRLIIIIIGIPICLKYGLELAISFLIITNIFSELTSIIIFLCLIPKKFKINKSFFSIKYHEIKDVLSISLPTTGSRLIGNFGHFLEPIIISTILLKYYPNSFIINEYGIINGYVLQLILLPSFFSSAISQALLPIVSKNYILKNYNYIKQKIKQACLFSLLIGVPATILIELFPDKILKFIFNTTEGINYIHFLAPIFIFHYIQAPIVSSLQAIGKASTAMKNTLIGMIIKTIFLILLCYLKIGLWPLIISITINILLVTFLDIKKLNKCLV